MSTAPAPKKTYELIAIIFLLPALYLQYRWISIFSGSESTSPSARTARFMDIFPEVFSARSIVFICLAFAVLAVVFASKSFNQRKLVWRISSFMVVMLGSLIALLSLFQML